MRYRILGCSMLSALKVNHDWRPAADENDQLGFLVWRIFAGRLPWASQELRDVYANLPGLLTEARQRGRHVLLDYHTEAGTGYDLEAHTRELESITAGRDNVLKSVSNEPWHPSQGNRLSPERCRDLAGMMAGPVSFGASADDEDQVYIRGAAWGAKHRDRGRELWNDVRRQRELLATQELAGIPILDEEGKGAGEATVSGKRENTPSYFYTQAALAQLFNLGGSIFHSDSGLHAVPLGPNQRRCAEAFIAGWHAVPERRYAYRNVGHGGSPIAAARFNEGNMSHEGCTRSYSGLDGERGVNVTLGISGNPGLTWGNGWRAGAILGEMPGVRVCEVVR
jgi:hypothetical protein